MWNNLDTKCGGTSELQVASYVDFAISILLFIFTTPLLLSLVYSLCKYKHLLVQNFYLVVLNILIADCLMAVICGPMSISFHIKEALGPDVVTISDMEQSSMHFIFFFTNIVAVLSMALLALDRLGVILSPFDYHRTLTKPRMKLLLLLTWLTAGGITITYVYIGYIRFLVVFSFSTVILTLIFMLITMLLLKHRLKIAKAYDMQRRDSRASERHHHPRGSMLLSFRRRTENTIEFTEADKKITKTFLWMLVLFILNYVPCVILVIYMNMCVQCDCEFVHIMRDIIWIMILASPLCRGLNFLMRLKTLREAVNANCIFRHDDDESNINMPFG